METAGAHALMSHLRLGIGGMIDEVEKLGLAATVPIPFLTHEIRSRVAPENGVLVNSRMMTAAGQEFFS